MIPEKFWSKNRFPIVYQDNEPKAVMVDMASFDKIELILDNLTRREAEPEDAFLAASGLLEKLVEEAKASPVSQDWVKDLNAI